MPMISQQTLRLVAYRSVIPQGLAILGFKQRLMRELRANLRDDEFSLKGGIGETGNLLVGEFLASKSGFQIAV
jgi:hypothetical protein